MACHDTIFSVGKKKETKKAFCQNLMSDLKKKQPFPQPSDILLLKWRTAIDSLVLRPRPKLQVGTSRSCGRLNSEIGIAQRNETDFFSFVFLLKGKIKNENMKKNRKENMRKGNVN